MNSNKTTTSRSFEYKTKIIRNTPDDNHTLDTEVVVPLEYLSSFWRSLDLSLTKCEICQNVKKLVKKEYTKGIY